LADELAALYPRVRVVHLGRNAGYGPAVLRGLAEATKDYVFYTDADRQYDYDQFRQLWPQSAKYDALIGYRRRRRDPWMRHIFAKGYAALLKIFFGFPWRDADCSFKFFRREALRGVVIDSRSGFVEAELLIKCRLHGLTIKEVPVRHFARPAGRVSFEVMRWGPVTIVRVKPVWAMLADIVRCRRRLSAYARQVRHRRFRREAGVT